MTQNGVVNTPVSSGGSSAGSIPIPASGEIRLMVRENTCHITYKTLNKGYTYVVSSNSEKIFISFSCFFFRSLTKYH